MTHVSAHLRKVLHVLDFLVCQLLVLRIVNEVAVVAADLDFGDRFVELRRKDGRLDHGELLVFYLVVESVRFVDERVETALELVDHHVPR